MIQFRKLNDLIIPNKKSSFQVKTASEYGDFPFFTSGIKIKRLNQSLVSGQNIYVATGGKAYFQYFDGNASYSSDCFSFSTIKNEIDTKYLYYFLHSKTKFINDNMFVGAALKHLQRKDFLNIDIPIFPINVQTKIAAKLDAIFSEIDKAITATEANAKNAEALFESYLTKVFEFSGDGWVTKSLLELANEDCSLSYGIVQPGEDFENGLPIVRPTNLTKKYISKNELKTINPVLANSYKRTTLTGKELLLCVRGTTGTVSLSTDELKDCNVTRGIVPIRFKPDEIDLDYAYYFFNSSVLQKQIKSKTYGAALLQINIADIKKLQIIVPKLLEQKKIVANLDLLKQHINILINSQKNKIENLICLKNSILKQAFNGELIKE